MGGTAYATATGARRVEIDAVVVVVGVAAVCRLVLAARLGLLADEAYYTTWPLAWGHLDHPPGVAWMLAATAWVPGSLGVRLGAVACGVVAALATASVSRDPLVTAAAWVASPVLLATTTFATPDAPLLAAWAVGLAAAARGRWELAGVAGGVAALCKLTGWLLVPLLVAAAWGERRRWRAVAVAAFVAAPNVAWNAAHGWSSVRFQLAHGLGGEVAPGLAGGASFTLAQLAVAGPVVLAAIWAARGLPAADGVHGRAERYAWVTGLGVLALFALASLRSPGEANWAAPTWCAATVGLGAVGSWVRWPVGAGMVACTLAAGLALTGGGPAVRFTEGEAVVAWVERTVPGEPVWSERYQEASWLARAGWPIRRPAGCGRIDAHPREVAVDGWLLRPARGGTGVCGGLEVVGPVYTEALTPSGRWQLLRVRR